MPPQSPQTNAEASTSEDLIDTSTTNPMKETAETTEKVNEESITSDDKDSTDISETTVNKSDDDAPLKIVWRNVIVFGLIHLASVYGAYLIFTSAKWQTNLLCFFLYVFSGLGVTAGAHRLWAHRSYKAKFPLRVLLAFMFTISYENDIYDWSRDHRVHHKYSETHADPHNARRGFFFAHVGWLLCRKHPEVIKKGNAVALGDLLADPVVRFHRKYYLWLVLAFCVILPTAIPMYLWNESFLNALLVTTIFRMCFTHNQTWLVNSAAHMWGTQPYDIHINPRQNALTVLGAIGEGFHNYHHTFPYDYATSEYGIKYNLTTMFIDAMAWIGLAYDRKTASREMITARKLRTGPESLKNSHQETVERIKDE